MREKLIFIKCHLCGSDKLTNTKNDEWNCINCDLWFYETDMRAEYKIEEMIEIGVIGINKP